MRARDILVEVNQVERDLNRLELENALHEMLQDRVLSELYLAEERKIIKYATSRGIINGKDLNEGMVADIGLALGQAVGSLPFLAQTGLGAAFGAAGVLWYGKEMLKQPIGSFDFFMNLIFALFSAAAIEPTGVFGEAGALGKLIKPFVALGSKAKALGGASKAAANAFINALGPAEKAIVAAAPKVEGPIKAGMGFVSSKVMPQIPKILEAVKGTVSKLPGGQTFAKIADFIIKYAGQAWKVVSEALGALLNIGKAAGAEAAVGVSGTLAKGVEAALASMSKQAPAQLEKIFAGKGIQYMTKSGEPLLVTIRGVSETGTILLTGPGNRQMFVAAQQVPAVLGQVAKQLGDDVATAILARIQKQLPITSTKAALEAISSASK